MKGRSILQQVRRFSSQPGPLTRRLQDTDMVICAEGFVFELERRGYLQHGPFVPRVILEEPAIVLQLHRETLRAGTDVVLACQYYAHKEKMRLIGEEHLVEKINRKAMELAHQANTEFGGPALVAGNLCNTNIFDPDLGDANEEEVRQIFREVCEWSAQGGADFILGETFHWTREAEIALEEIQRVGLESVLNFAIYSTVDGTPERTRDGDTIIEAFNRLKNKGVTVVGLNCFRGPFTTLPLLDNVINQGYEGELAAIPVAYRTTDEKPTFWKLTSGSTTHFSELEEHLATRLDFADFATQSKEIGVRFIGTCCGGWSQHVRSMSEALGRTVPASRYSPDMAKHYLLGNDSTLSKRNMIKNLGAKNV